MTESKKLLEKILEKYNINRDLLSEIEERIAKYIKVPGGTLLFSEIGKQRAFKPDRRTRRRIPVDIYSYRWTDGSNEISLMVKELQNKLQSIEIYVSPNGELIAIIHVSPEKNKVLVYEVKKDKK